MAVGVLIYYTMVANQKQSKGQPTTQALLVGYGFVIPFSFWLPFYIIDTLDMRNGVFRLAFCCIPMTITLRCLEAMYGFLPSLHQGSLWNYLLSIGFVVRPTYDANGQTKPITIASFLYLVWNFVRHLSIFTFMYNIFSPTAFGVFPFETSVVANEVWLSFDLPHIYNTFIQATMMNRTLALSMGGAAALASLLAGVDMDTEVTKNPMFESTSPSDFWGRRWNNLIHVGLKQGVYKPVRWHTGSASLASLAAFVASGIYHEYVWQLIFFWTTAQLAEGYEEGSDCCRSCYCNAWVGKQFVFFGWNGVLIVLEYLVGDQVGKWTQRVPSFLKSHLVVLLSLPVGHLFTADVTEGGYFYHLQHLTPLLVFQNATESPGL